MDAEASASFKKQPHETVCFLKEALARDDSLVALGRVARSFTGSLSPNSMTQSNASRITGF
jgi:hypothetical protein